jgi:hypothetical protein
LFEIGVVSVIVFALAYWTTLFIMGRRKDVLHGEFVETEPELASASAAPAVIFPPRPVIVPRQIAAPKKVLAPAPVAAKPPAPPLPAVAAAPEKPADTEALQSLLVSLKQELRNAAQI